MSRQIKVVFSELPDKYFKISHLKKVVQVKKRKKLSRLQQSIESLKETDNQRRKNIKRFIVLLCGDHNGKQVNLTFLKKLQSKFIKYGFTCYIGEDYIEKVQGIPHKDVQHEYLTSPDLIIFINGKGEGTRNESNEIRRLKKLKKKTIAFFKYKNLEELMRIPDKGDFISEFIALQQSFPVN